MMDIKRLISRKNSPFSEGGYCKVYKVEENSEIVFKLYEDYEKMQEHYRNQIKLAKYNLAPKVYNIEKNNSLIGYFTECAFMNIDTEPSIRDIKSLVKRIFNKTGLIFWDCHYCNIGYVNRGKYKKLVCTDSGNESFEPSGLCDEKIEEFCESLEKINNKTLFN